MVDSEKAEVVLAGNTKARTGRWRQLLVRAAACVSFLVMVVLGVFFYRGHRAETALKDAIAEADRLDPGWRLEDLEAKRTAVPDDQNSAPRIQKAGRGIIVVHNIGTNGSDLADSLENLETLTPRNRVAPMQAAKLRTALLPYAVMLKDCRKIAEFPDGRFAFDTSPPLSYGVPHVDHTRIAARLLRSDAILQLYDRNSEQAWTNCRAILNIGRSFGDEPMELAPIVRALLVADAIREMERTLAQAHITGEDLAESQHRLHDEMKHPALLICMRSARAQLHAMMTQVESGKFRMAELQLVGTRNGNAPGIQDEIRGFLSAHKAKPAHTWLLRYTTQTVEIAKLPDKDACPALEKLESTIADAPDLARQLAPKSGRFVRLQSFRALLACAHVGLATERYRLKHDRWPAELADLVAERLLDELPADSYDGKPLRYRKTADGVVIYSVGPSGDGKGDALDGNPPNASDERLEFRLWNGDKC